MRTVTAAQAAVLTAPEAAALIRPGDKVYVAGNCGEPTAVLDAVAADPQLWQDVHLIGVFIPGVNDRDYSAHGINTRVSTIFATPGLRAGKSAGQIHHLPLHYSEVYRHFAAATDIACGFMQVTPPRSDGTISFGISADFSTALLDGPTRLIGIINPQMPDPPHGPRVPVSRFEAFVKADAPLPTYDAGSIDDATMAIGRTIAGMLKPGDTLQLGLGKVQAAILANLGEVSDLGFHAGMIATPLLDPLRNGVFSRGITTGVALGTTGFYEELRQDERIRFAPVNFTHSIATLAAIDGLVSVNSVIEMDLYGQANAEVLGGLQISGQGGLVDFVRGAKAARGGKSILALASTAARGRISRIVPRLAAGTPVTVTRADVDLVVTEHGVADLRFASLGERAEKLIAIADPRHRDELEQEWREIQRHPGRET